MPNACGSDTWSPEFKAFQAYTAGILDLFSAVMAGYDLVTGQISILRNCLRDPGSLKEERLFTCWHGVLCDSFEDLLFS
jgi:hypothetical protein